VATSNKIVEETKESVSVVTAILTGIKDSSGKKTVQIQPLFPDTKIDINTLITQLQTMVTELG